MQEEEPTAKSRIDSVDLFRIHDLCWYFMGFSAEGKKPLYGLLDLFVTFTVTVPYPTHLLIGLFMSESKQDAFANLVMDVTVVALSVKFFIFRSKIKKMQKLKEILRRLDSHVEGDDECDYFKKIVVRNAYMPIYAVSILYGMANVTALSAIITSSERRLMYPGWFPFDWKSSTEFYTLAAFYQAIGLAVESVLNFCNDVYPPLALAILAGHLHLLKMRIAKVGHDAGSDDKKNRDKLILCFQDYKDLIEAYKIIENMISLALFFQFLCEGLNISVTIVYMALFVKTIFQLFYYIMQLGAFLVELFPVCYYGTLVVYEFTEIPYAIFSSNWIDQQKRFHTNMLIFTEATLKVKTALAGGMIFIHIDSFFTTCKMAYSIFTLLTTLK